LNEDNPNKARTISGTIVLLTGCSKANLAPLRIAVNADIRKQGDISSVSGDIMSSRQQPLVDSDSNGSLWKVSRQESITKSSLYVDPGITAETELALAKRSSKQGILYTQADGMKRQRTSAIKGDTKESNRTGKTTACDVSEEVSYRNSEHDDIVHRAGDSNCDVSQERQPWTQDIHRQFVEAIYEIGMTHASPSLIMEQMALAFQDGSSNGEECDRSLTSEHLKSHLQKYRKNKQKSREDFMREYDQWLTKARGIESVAKTKIAPANVAKMIGYKTLLGGDAAAYLTYSVMMEEGESMVGHRNNGAIDAARTVMHNSLLSAMEYAEYLSGAVIRCPSMTEEERHSSVGVSLSHVIGMFYSLTRTLMAERHQAATTPALTSDASDDDQEPQARLTTVGRSMPFKSKRLFENTTLL
jgi:hypothetical protein